MTTFKNNAKYAELLFSYLELSMREDNPLTPQLVLLRMRWRFKGGNLKEVADATRLQPETSTHHFPDGDSASIAEQWGSSRDALSLAQIVSRRSRRLKKRATEALVGTWLFLNASYNLYKEEFVIYSGMKAVYFAFGRLWEAAPRLKGGDVWDLLEQFSRELTVGTSMASKMHLDTVLTRQSQYWRMLSQTRVEGLLRCVLDIKELLRLVRSRPVKAQARQLGKEIYESWEPYADSARVYNQPIPDLGDEVLCTVVRLGAHNVRVSQGVVLLTTGTVRFALSVGDLERLHQLTMSAASCLVGACAQSVIGTPKQISNASLALEVSERNIQRIVESSRRVPLGDEVLVCKGYRRAYTAHLAVLAGPLCQEELRELLREAEETAPDGVLDIGGYTEDLRGLDAANSLNAGKVFKICPAPDVSPGAAMVDRVKQIGDCNIFDPQMAESFRVELRDQILRAYLRASKGRMRLRDEANRPAWWVHYLKKELERVPTSEIHQYVQWEGSAKMPTVSPYDPANWKDAGLGADSMREALDQPRLGCKKNMITRLLFDDDCPMPGKPVLSDEHMIKFFVKAEGHKDPARGIFSSNLVDRQAQSWMEKAVEKVARRHPSFMIGAPIDVKDMKIRQLTAVPRNPGWVALFYSFDISGWSAKMPAEPQRISHSIWAELYGGHLFNRATQVNEGATIYVNLEGYFGWYRNTASNLEGFNGKEMTMVLVALLSLSVRVWRRRVVEEGHLTAEEARATTALLFAYIDDGLSRIDLPAEKAVAAFDCYKLAVIDTFARCGFSVETSKCFPSDRFAIFLNEVYLGGRHVVHGVRAAMGISSEPTERHTTLVERLTTVSTGCRGAVMAGLPGLSAVFLMAYHSLLHIIEWTQEDNPVILAVWCLSPRSWGGLGLPNMLQMSVSGSGAAFEEGVATLQGYARANRTAKSYFLTMARTALEERSAVSVLTAPLSSRVSEGYMVDSRVAGLVRDALKNKMEQGRLSSYAERLLRYGDGLGFKDYAEAVVHVGHLDVVQEQMLTNVMEAHPHSIFSSFARRVEKSATVSSILGFRAFQELMQSNRSEVKESVEVVRAVLSRAR